MNKIEKQAYEQALSTKTNNSLRFSGARLHMLDPREQYLTPSSVEGVNDLTTSLLYNGGLAQQDRMIRDKRQSLNKAVKYSYQGAMIKRVANPEVEIMEGTYDYLPARALINPNKVKQDYDEKIISVGHEYHYKPGDVIE